MNESKKKRASAISATEFMAQLEKSEEFQRSRKIREEALSARAAELRSAEQPIVADLRGAGVTVNSVWGLVNSTTPYPDAIPVLMRHLEIGQYPERVMESMGRALAVRPSVTFWEKLKSLYLSARSAGEREGLAVALAAAASSNQTNDLIEFLRMPGLGETRIYFVAPLLRVGGSVGRHIVEGLTGDPTLGKEANLRLSRTI